MTSTVIALLAVVAVLATGMSVVLFLAGRARARVLSNDVRRRIEPYLRRKAAESGLPAVAPTWTRRTRPEEVVGYSVGLAEQLLEGERTGHDPRALAQTQPVTSVDERIEKLVKGR